MLQSTMFDGIKTRKSGAGIRQSALPFRGMIHSGCRGTIEPIWLESVLFNLSNRGLPTPTLTQLQSRWDRYLLPFQAADDIQAEHVMASLADSIRDQLRRSTMSPTGTFQADAPRTLLALPAPVPTSDDTFSLADRPSDVQAGPARTDNVDAPRIIANVGVIEHTKKLPESGDCIAFTGKDANGIIVQLMHPSAGQEAALKRLCFGVMSTASYRSKAHGRCRYIVRFTPERKKLVLALCDQWAGNS